MLRKYFHLRLDQPFQTDYKKIIELLLNEGFTLKEIVNHRSKKVKFKKIEDVNSQLTHINTMIYCEKL